MSTSKTFLAWIGRVAAIDLFVVMVMWYLGVLIFGLIAMSKL